jgi:hypothetical protein
LTFKLGSRVADSFPFLILLCTRAAHALGSTPHEAGRAHKARLLAAFNTHFPSAQLKRE